MLAATSFELFSSAAEILQLMKGFPLGYWLVLIAIILIFFGTLRGFHALGGEERPEKDGAILAFERFARLLLILTLIGTNIWIFFAYGWKAGAIAVAETIVLFFGLFIAFAVVDNSFLILFPRRCEVCKRRYRKKNSFYGDSYPFSIYRTKTDRISLFAACYACLKKSETIEEEVIFEREVQNKRALNLSSENWSQEEVEKGAQNYLKLLMNWAEKAPSLPLDPSRYPTCEMSRYYHDKHTTLLGLFPTSGMQTLSPSDLYKFCLLPNSLNDGYNDVFSITEKSCGIGVPVEDISTSTGSLYTLEDGNLAIVWRKL